MTIYFINTSLIIFYALIQKIWIENNRQTIRQNSELNNGNKSIVVIIAIQLFLLSSLKGETVGVDMLAYSPGFQRISYLDWMSLSEFPWEYGYVLLNRIISVFTTEFRYVIAIISGVVIYLFSRHIYKESKIPWLSFYLFICMDFFSFTLSGYRQSLAMAISLIAVKYIRSNNVLKFILTILVASFFHQASLIFLLVYPISKIRINKIYLMSLSFLGIFIFIFGNKVIQIFIGFYDRKQIVVSGEGLGMFLMLLLITTGGLLFYKYAKRQDRDIHLYCQIMLMAVLLQIFSFHLSIFVRVVSYLSIHMIIFIPNIIRAIPSKHLRLIGTVVVVLMSTLFYIYTLSGNPSGTVPYYFMFN